MRHIKIGWVSFTFMLYITMSLSRGYRVLCFVQNPCSGTGMTFQRRDASVMSYDIGFLVDMYTGLYETEELAEGALATLETDIRNPAHLRSLKRRQVASLYSDLLDASNTDRALNQIYDTLDRIMVFVIHTERQILRVNYTKLREPILQSLIMLKQGETTGGLYYIMCRIMLHLPKVVNTGSIGFELVPFYLHGVSRGHVFDNAYVSLNNIKRVLVDLRRDLGDLIESLEKVSEIQ